MAETLLIAVDETCPGCEYPEVTGVISNMEMQVYYCNHCGWSSTEWPNNED